jgi:hypothetical protein
LNVWLEEKLSYRGRGSYRFSEDQRTSYALILDVEIISYVREPYVNLGWNTPRGFWGNFTEFHGTSIAKSGQMNFAKQRVISVKNEALMDYLRDKQNFENEARLITNWEEALEFAFEQFVPFEGLPLLRHDETVLKFVANPLTQFQFNCYWLRALDNPDDLPEFTPSDPSKDDDEYPSPERREPSDPFNPEKPVSAPNPGSDSRDFPEPLPLEPVPNEGYGYLTLAGVYSGGTAFFSMAAPGAPVGYPGTITAGDSPERPGIRGGIFWTDSEGVVTYGGDLTYGTVINLVQVRVDGETVFSPSTQSLTI